MPWRPDGVRLRALRELRGWTLEDLASRSGVSDRQIRAIESSRPPATIQLRTLREPGGFRPKGGRTLAGGPGTAAQSPRGGKGAGEPLYLSIFTRSVEHTRRLIEAERQAQSVCALARVVVARPKGEWKGFFIF